MAGDNVKDIAYSGYISTAGHADPLIIINGYPGVGKYSVASALKNMIAGAKLFNNHLLIDPVAALLEREDPGYTDLRKALRAPILDVIAHNPTLKQRTIITTHYQQVKRNGHPVDSHEFLACAQRGKRPFVSVILQCGEEENIRRLVSRPASAKTKLMDPEILLGLRRKHVLYSYDGDEGVERMTGEVRVDVGTLSAEEAAGVVLGFLQKRLELQLVKNETGWENGD